MNASVLILTLNEEINLPDCLRSVGWSDDVVVFDSFSSDRTLEIAKTAGARIIQRHFDDYASHKNSALREVRYKYPWVLMVDADERVTPALKNEIIRVISSCENDNAIFFVRRKDILFDRWLRHSSGYPVWFGRLVRPSLVTVKRAVNEEYHYEGKAGFLQEHLEHFPLNKGIAHWFDRHNRYSTMEASIICPERAQAVSYWGIVSDDPVIRRRGLKRLAYRLPARPIFVFAYLYIIRLGILDGWPGLTYCIMRSVYEFMIDLKVKEMMPKFPAKGKRMTADEGKRAG